MNKLGELVAAKEIDPTKPVLEQPGGQPQKFIKDLLRAEEEVLYPFFFKSPTNRRRMEFPPLKRRRRPAAPTIYRLRRLMPGVYCSCPGTVYSHVNESLHATFFSHDLWLCVCVYARAGREGKGGGLAGLLQPATEI